MRNILNILTFAIKAAVSIFLFFYTLSYLFFLYEFKKIIWLPPADAILFLQEPYVVGKLLVIVAIILLVAVAFLYVKSEYEKFNYLREYKIYSVTLDELSRIWGIHNEAPREKEIVPILYLKNFTLERTQNFIADNMEKNMRFFPQDKLEIIFALFKILEQEAKAVSSVASRFSSDPEMSASYQSAITQDGKRSYDVFKEIDLYEHTMNVAEECVAFLKEADPISYETTLCDGIIVALAHDIGKLEQIKHFNKVFASEILTKNSHQAISKIFFSEAWPGYNSIEDAIYNHHSAPNSNSILTRMIIKSDKKARERELLEWRRKRKEEENKPAQIEEKKEPEKKEDVVNFTYNTNKNNEENQRAEQEKDSILLDKIKKRIAVEDEVKEDEEKFTFEVKKPNKKVKSFVILPPEEAEKEHIKPTITDKDYSEELESKIHPYLAAAINQYSSNKIQNINSISYYDCVLFSITFFNEIVKKHLTADESSNAEFVRQTSMNLIAHLHKKGYTQHISPSIGISTFFLYIDKKKHKYFCVPIKGEVFNMGTYELDQSKDDWMKSITVTPFVA